MSQSNRRKSIEVSRLEIEIERLEEDAAHRNSIMDTHEQNFRTLTAKPEVCVRQGLIQRWIETINKRKEKCDASWENRKQFFLTRDEQSGSSATEWKTVGRPPKSDKRQNHSNKQEAVCLKIFVGY